MCLFVVTHRAGRDMREARPVRLGSVRPRAVEPQPKLDDGVVYWHGTAGLGTWISSAYRNVQGRQCGIVRIGYLAPVCRTEMRTQWCAQGTESKPEETEFIPLECPPPSPQLRGFVQRTVMSGPDLM